MNIVIFGERNPEGNLLEYNITYIKWVIHKWTANPSQLFQYEFAPKQFDALHKKLQFHVDWQRFFGSHSV